MTYHKIQVDTLDLNAEELCKPKGARINKYRDMAMKLWEFYHTPLTYWVSILYMYSFYCDH